MEVKNWWNKQIEGEVYSALHELDNINSPYFKVKKANFDTNTSNLILEMIVSRKDMKLIKKKHDVGSKNVRQYLKVSILEIISKHILAKEITVELRLKSWFSTEIIYEGRIHNSIYDYVKQVD